MKDLERNQAVEAARKTMYDAGCELLNASLSQDLAASIAESIRHGTRVEFTMTIPGGDLVVRLCSRRDTHEILRAVTTNVLDS